MDESQSLVIYFRPGVPPAKRHAIDDELEEALGETGEVTGGGTMMDMSESDTSLDVTDVAAAVPILRETLRRLRVPRGTVIVRHDPEEQWPVYGEGDAGPEPAPTPSPRREPRPERQSKWKD